VTDLTDKERVDILVHIFQQNIPETVVYSRKVHRLTDEESMAVGRVIWYILKLGWGLSSAISKVRTKFRVRKVAVIERAAREAFPDGYLKSLENAKRGVFMQRLETQGGDGAEKD
jgi:hypothetical protein